MVPIIVASIQVKFVSDGDPTPSSIMESSFAFTKLISIRAINLDSAQEIHHSFQEKPSVSEKN